jgi:hypothetical protein
MTRIILQVPFMRHYAGSVFDLKEDLSCNSDAHYYERIKPKCHYHLPDNGRGSAVDLPISDTILCPPSVFENMDLTTGPCRVTSVKTIGSDNDWGENQVILSENKQKLMITDLARVTRLFILDKQSQKISQEQPISTPSVFLDFSTLSTGFYDLNFFYENTILYNITLIKCFPLVVTKERGTSKFMTTETIW